MSDDTTLNPLIDRPAGGPLAGLSASLERHFRETRDDRRTRRLREELVREHIEEGRGERRSGRLRGWWRRLRGG